MARYKLKIIDRDEFPFDYVADTPIPIPNVGEVVIADGTVLKVDKREFSYRCENDFEYSVTLYCAPVG